MLTFAHLQIYLLFSNLAIIIRSVFTFYRSFASAAWGITLFLVWAKLRLGDKSSFFIPLTKLITYGAVIYVIDVYKQREFYYYRNIGLSKPTLWVTSLLLDWLFFWLVIYLSGLWS